MINIVFKRLLTEAYKILAKIAPKANKKITFISYPDASDNSWHLYRYLTKNVEGYTFVWLINSPRDLELIKKIRSENNSSINKIVIIKKNSMRGLLHFATSKNIFHTHGTYSFVRFSSNARIVNLWHGMPLKRIGALDKKRVDEICHSDLILSTSKFFSMVMSDAFCTHEKKILDIGLPRNDVLTGRLPIDGSTTQSLLKSKLIQKFIMWLPTYRKSFIGDIRQDSKISSFIDEWSPLFFQKANDSLRLNKTHLIVKIHPMDCMNISDMPSGYSNILFLSAKDWGGLNVDLYDVLSLSSGLISDVSSVIIDYQLTGKPIALTGKSIEEYERGLIDGISIEEDIRPITIRTSDDFQNFLNTCISPYPKGWINPKFHSYRIESSCSLIESGIIKAEST